MNIFNSLGSNYTLGFVLQTLLSRNTRFPKLESYIEKKYQGKAILLYKGREAIELALSLLNLPKDASVAINGFTCYAVYKAIVNTGYGVEYLDIKDGDLNFSPELFRARVEKNPNMKVLIIQNTLGYPCIIKEIEKICKQNNIFLIEDLAHSIGMVYENNQEAGTVGDFTILSFSQDKMIDGISGGALIIRNKKFQKIDSLQLDNITIQQQLIDRLYPFFTYLIRTTYRIGLGKIIHILLKKAHLLSHPMGERNSLGLHTLPHWYHNLIYTQLKNIEENLSHRRHIASIYVQNIKKTILPSITIKHISHATHLRFPLFVSQRNDLIVYLKKSGVYISDIWYDAPIAPRKYLPLTNYKNQCPESERISSQITNLPTHRNISAKEAKEIAQKINQWLK